MDTAKDKKILTLERNDTILDQFSEDLKSYADEHNKIKANNPQFTSLYLPSISKIYSLLGFISNEKQILDLFEDIYEVPLEISRTNKYDLFNKGVGLSTAGKVTNWLKKTPLPLEELVNERKEFKNIMSQLVGSNASNWLSAIRIMKLDFKDSYHGVEGVFSSLFRFVEQRSKSDFNFSLIIWANIEAGKLNSDNIVDVWKLEQSRWKKTQCIIKHASKRVVKFMLLQQKKAALSEQQVLYFLESSLYLELDFFMEAITAYEVGHRIHFATNKEEIESLNTPGSITHAINAYATQEDIKTCFGGLLQEFKDISPDLVAETSYRKLASFIEIEESETNLSGESIENKQYKQLKDWRNGKNLPSNKKLMAFLKNLDEYANIDSGIFSFFMCKITMGVDKLVNEILADTKNEACSQVDIKVAIKKVLANIPDYYISNLVKELEEKNLKKSQ